MVSESTATVIGDTLAEEQWQSFCAVVNGGTVAELLWLLAEEQWRSFCVVVNGGTVVELLCLLAEEQ